MSASAMLLAAVVAVVLCLLPLADSRSPLPSRNGLLDRLVPAPPSPSSPVASDSAVDLPRYVHLLHRHDSLGRHYRRQRDLGLLPPLPSAPAPAQFFTQRLDHFDRSNPATFQQRYFVNASLWDGKGPVLFLVGWEGPMESSYVAGVWAINSFAEPLHALIVCLEHRFYGQSVPNNDQSIDRLRYLTSEQALEDAANWALHINAQYNVPVTSKWVVTGGSYSGFLAAAARSKYPHLYAGALAVSGPVQAQVDYRGYNEVVGVALGPQCEAALKSANDKVTQLLSSVTGQAQLANDFHLCAPLSDPLSQAIFVSTWSYDIGGMVQYAGNGTVAGWCDRYMKLGGGVPYEGLRELYFPNRTRCYDGFNFTDLIRDSVQPGDGRSWGYQTCAEWGYFQTGSSPKQPMSSKLTADLSLRWCEAVYNVTAATVYSNVGQSNAHYGGFGIQATNVVFSNGQLDPWHVSAVYPPNTGGSSSNVVYLITNASHCTDFDRPTTRDSDSLRTLRRLQTQAVAKWIA